MFCVRAVFACKLPAGKVGFIEQHINVGYTALCTPPFSYLSRVENPMRLRAAAPRLALHSRGLRREVSVRVDQGDTPKHVSLRRGAGRGQERVLLRGGGGSAGFVQGPAQGTRR